MHATACPTKPAPASQTSGALSVVAPDPSTASYARLVWLWHRHTVGHLSDDQRDELDAASDVVRALRKDSWVQRFLECAARDAAGSSLGGGRRSEWLSRQRRAAVAGSLPAGRAELLHRLRGFTWTPGDDRWISTFRRVREYADQSGRIPARGDDEVLAGWLAAQRFALRSGRLSIYRAGALESLPGWAESLSGQRLRSTWDQDLAALRAFVDDRGRYPHSDTPDRGEAALASWVYSQRELYRRGDMSGDRVQTLAQIPGWRWAAREADFDARANELDRELAGGPITRDHRLYSWVVSQRRRHRDGRLSAEQADTLRALNLLEDCLAGAR